MSEAPLFQGMGPKALPFLKAVGFHQDRAWFQDNKALYESDIKKPLGDLVEHLSTRMETEGLPFRGSRKTSLFRINRDVRFSKNKDPYNTHCSAVLTRTGTKRDDGLVYIHMSNERCFMSAGFYGLSTAALTALRRAIVDRKGQFFKQCEPIEEEGLSFDHHDDALKRNPRGFEKITDERLQSIIRQKHLTVTNQISADLITTPDLADHMIAFAHLTLPLIEFGWSVVDPVRAEERLRDSQ